MNEIQNIHARQIIDSRGTPTLEVDCKLRDGSFGRAAVPSGASTGEHEALELRDSTAQYFGKSVYQAIENVNIKIAQALIGQPAEDIYHIDKIMLNLDGTKNKDYLGANAILGVSLASLKALAQSHHMHLYEYIHSIFNTKADTYSMPIPMMNILNGGAHADNNVDIQEFMIYPKNFRSFSDSLRAGCEIFNTLKTVLKKNGYNTAVGDEGGFAPNLKSNQEALDLILEAIELSNYKPGEDIFLALDVAASELYNRETSKYILKSENLELTSDEMIAYYSRLCTQYPIISIEDGLDENDWGGWIKLTSAFKTGMQVVGDDLTVTNPQRLRRAIDESAMNAILIKLNQIGTVSETLDVISLAQQYNFGTIISHRSGETEDTTIADLAVGTCAGQIKTGSLCRSERVAKYNQLIRIEENLTTNHTE